MLETVFIKEFLTPVHPTDENSFTPKAIETAKSICAEFEREKKRLYDSLKECKGGGIVYPTDFFRFKSKYYMITPKIEMSSITIEEISKLDTNTKIMICKVIAYNMIAIHKKRIIHADIKSNNVLIKKTITGTYTAKIIDFDSSYFEDSLPTPDDLQCDTIYLSPEGFLYICEETEKITTKADIFALGILFCQYLTGDMPFLILKNILIYMRLYWMEDDICIKNNIPEEIKLVLLKMLSKNPGRKTEYSRSVCSLVIKDKNVKKTAPDVKTESKKKGFKSAHTNL